MQHFCGVVTITAPVTGIRCAASVGYHLCLAAYQSPTFESGPKVWLNNCINALLLWTTPTHRCVFANQIPNQKVPHAIQSKGTKCFHFQFVGSTRIPQHGLEYPDHKSASRPRGWNPIAAMQAPDSLWWWITYHLFRRLPILHFGYVDGLPHRVAAAF